MTAISEDVINALVSTTEEIVKLDEEYEQLIDDAEAKFRRDVEVLLRERQRSIDANEDFWANVLALESAPTSGLMNEAADPRILRAIKSFQILTTVHDNGDFTQRVVMKLRPNMYIGNEELFKEFDPEGNVTTKSGVHWKPGMQKARADSFFCFFEEDGAERDGETLKALETVFHNPFGFLEAANK